MRELKLVVHEEPKDNLIYPEEITPGVHMVTGWHNDCLYILTFTHVNPRDKRFKWMPIYYPGNYTGIPALQNIADSFTNARAALDYFLEYSYDIKIYEI